MSVPPQPRSVDGSGRVIHSQADDAFSRRCASRSQFRRLYDRGDLPVYVDHTGGRSNRVGWRLEREALDYHHYLPVFMEGLCEQEDPYRFLAIQGSIDLIEAASERIVPVIPQLILPLKKALNTRSKFVVLAVAHILITMLRSSRGVGLALVPYYRQLLPVLGMFRNCQVNCGDDFEWAQWRGLGIADAVNAALEACELTGGQDALINIKYVIPGYESVARSTIN